jgi:hypothetical protein
VFLGETMVIVMNLLAFIRNGIQSLGEYELDSEGSCSMEIPANEGHGMASIDPMPFNQNSIHGPIEMYTLGRPHISQIRFVGLNDGNLGTLDSPNLPDMPEETEGEERLYTVFEIPTVIEVTTQEVEIIVIPEEINKEKEKDQLER